MSRFRYGRYDDGPDPLAAPYDVAGAVDAMGDRLLDGASPADALRDLMRRGTDGARGLDDLLRRVRDRRRELRRRGRLDGTLERVRELLDRALSAERAELFPDPSDDARLREAQLDTLPHDTARAVGELASYEWRSAEAREAYHEIEQLLRREVLDQQFQGLSRSLGAGAADPDAMARVKDMLADLNALLERRARGEDTAEDFDRFLDKHGALFPDRPASLDELLDDLARRQAAMERMLRSLTAQQREQLADLMQQAWSDMDLAAEMARLGDNLRALRPDAFRPGRERMTGDRPLGLPEASQALAELADLDALAEQLGQDYPGASLDDIDEDAVRRALGRQAVDDVQRLRAVERELAEQGYLVRRGGQLELSPKAVRRLGLAALRRVFADLSALARGEHDVRSAGAAGEATGASRAWEFGDEQPLDVVRTVASAVRRVGRERPLRLAPEDFAVVETERRSRAAVCLLVDASWSMALNGTWGQAKSTALALATLVETLYPTDALEIIGFSDLAAPVRPADLAAMDISMVQGTNLQHALMVAGRFLDRHPDHDPVVLVVTDGEPTAHLLADGRPWFQWPPDPETVTLTLAQVDAMTRRRARLNVFVLGDDPRLREFVDEVARRNGGRVFAPRADQLGAYVVRDFLTTRRGARGAR